ncbi:Zinc-regulated transporter 1 [Yarrowia sp. C11]|nr:Zinc-regulated transporter 1 [Yarrowia sp. C11]KAG5364445.1 Zinc-regulated transporter 1 [Yarrowia sp. E02]
MKPTSILCSALLATVASAFSPVNVHSIEPLINSSESLQVREILKVDRTRLLCAVDGSGTKRACLEDFRSQDIDVLASSLNNILLGKQLEARSQASSSFSGGDRDSNEELDCSFEPRNLKKPIRIGALFAVLATSALGVFPPVLATSVFKIDLQSLPMTFVKQFGTGVVLSTAYVHLAAESQEDFSNQCIGQLDYDPTAMSLVLAGTFIAFVLEYGSARWLRARKDRKKHNHSSDSEMDDTSKELPESKSTVDVIESQIDMSGAANMGCAAHSAALIDPTDKISVIIMEGGIIFHSALVGVAVTIASEDGFIALFIAILFHQTFEGIGLGSRIAGLKDSSLFFKLSMCTYFTIVTPIGMAIGLGVMDSMNSNDPATIWAIGTISALSAGVLMWAGLVEMLAFDWLFGDLSFAPKKRVFFALAGLVGGMICMSLIGKWA